MLYCGKYKPFVQKCISIFNPNFKQCFIYNILMKQKNVAGIFLIPKNIYILHLRFVMKAIFEFGLLPSEKFNKIL